MARKCGLSVKQLIYIPPPPHTPQHAGCPGGRKVHKVVLPSLLLDISYNLGEGEFTLGRAEITFFMT
jgi:hypothetical protein